MNNVIAIVGRPNVGKSTFFNRMIGRRKAIIDDSSGVTRDRIYGTSEWNGKGFTIIDTGGFVKNTDDIFEKAIKEQVHIAIEEADIILFMVDVKTGITDLDSEIAQLLRPVKKPVFIVVNKVDNFDRMLTANEFWALGFDNTFFLSSISGSGTGELLDAVSESLVDREIEEVDIPKLAIIGQPNVGKSSLVNAFTGEDRNIVTDIAGTTRDSINTVYKKYGKELLLVDTAGLRKKSKVHDDLEFYSVMRAVNAIERADVCLLLIDATDGIEAQDLSIMKLIQTRNKGIVLLVNKWDLIEKNTHTTKEYTDYIYSRTAPFIDFPVVFISALNKQRISKALDVALEVYENRQLKIPTSKLNNLMLKEIAMKKPPAIKGRHVKIKYVTQLKTHYPAFVFFCNYPQYVKADYKQFLENKLRQHFNFTGVPIKIYIRQK